MSFPFIPRKLTAKRNPNVSTPTVVPPQLPSNPQSQSNAISKGKEKAPVGPAPEECAALFCLALSEYALWSDPDLRMKLSGTEEDQPYIPLHYLLYHAQVLSPLRAMPQTLLVKHLKTVLPDALDFRMLVATPSPWFNPSGSSSSSHQAGGYEVRLKKWDPTSATISSKPDWEKRAVYVENVPINYRTVAALCNFLLALLPEREEPTTLYESLSRIQNIYLPPHHQDKPGDAPTFKGFAVVTFLHETDSQHLLSSWPWHPTDPDDLPHNGTEAAKDASKFRLRATSKAHWDALRAEYLLYREQLVDQMNASQDASAVRLEASASSHDHKPSKAAPTHTHDNTEKTAETPSRTTRERQPTPSNASKTSITLDSPYPYGCLVFVKNIHHETNKTTLKALFGKQLSKAGTLPNGGIDYVDFNKGMDTCHLRLSTPEHSQTLSSHFSSSPTVQTTGLDDCGSAPTTGGEKPITIEIVSGTREEMYWQKVPEKIRFGAVEKAVRLQSGDGLDSSSIVVSPPKNKEEVRPSKRRKR